MPGRHRDVGRFRGILGRGRRARPTAVPASVGAGSAGTGSVGTVEFADGPTGIAHRLTREAFAAGRRAGGRYVALCGAQVLPARLTAPARSHCPACEQDT
jgi:hypothetical protein